MHCSRYDISDKSNTAMGHNNLEMEMRTDIRRPFLDIRRALRVPEFGVYLSL